MDLPELQRHLLAPRVRPRSFLLWSTDWREGEEGRPHDIGALFAGATPMADLLAGQGLER